MSRKTRKLIWSVPLVAVLAVVGALAIFAALAPNGAQAQEVMVPGPVEGLEAVAKSRSSIELTWNAPAATTGGTPTGYRIDHSNDNRVWTLLKDNTGSTATKYTIATGITADTERYYRVFAINQAGTGPVSVDPVTAFASVPRTFPPTEPGRVTLTLALDTDDPYGKINLSWTEPSENGGSAVTDYEIVEMIDTDGVGGTPREMCGGVLGDGDYAFSGANANLPDPHPSYEIATNTTNEAATERDGWCLLIPEQAASTASGYF